MLARVISPFESGGCATAGLIPRMRESRYGHRMRLEDQHSLSLSQRELMMLGAGLKAYLQAFAAHREEDCGASHSEDEWKAIEKDVGRLLWRVEATMAGQADVEHSPEAVDPDA